MERRFPTRQAGGDRQWRWIPRAYFEARLEPYVTTKNHGTGLGLAVVKKIAEEHNARIDISNRVTNETVQGAQVSLSFAVDAQTCAR